MKMTLIYMAQGDTSDERMKEERRENEETAREQGACEAKCEKLRIKCISRGGPAISRRQRASVSRVKVQLKRRRREGGGGGGGGEGGGKMRGRIHSCVRQHQCQQALCFVSVCVSLFLSRVQWVRQEREKFTAPSVLLIGWPCAILQLASGT